jgi:hypothetical protein
MRINPLTGFAQRFEVRTDEVNPTVRPGDLDDETAPAVRLGFICAVHRRNIAALVRGGYQG